MGDINAAVVKIMYPDGSTLTRTAGPPLTLLTVDLVRKYGALADAVTRLGESHDLYAGVCRSPLASPDDWAEASSHYWSCLDAVFSARAALDTEEG